MDNNQGCNPGDSGLNNESTQYSIHKDNAKKGISFPLRHSTFPAIPEKIKRIYAYIIKNSNKIPAEIDAGNMYREKAVMKTL